MPVPRRPAAGPGVVPTTVPGAPAESTCSVRDLRVAEAGLVERSRGLGLGAAGDVGQLDRAGGDAERDRAGPVDRLALARGRRRDGALLLEGVLLVGVDAAVEAGLLERRPGPGPRRGRRCWARSTVSGRDADHQVDRRCPRRTWRRWPGCCPSTVPPGRVVGDLRGDLADLQAGRGDRLAGRGLGLVLQRRHLRPGWRPAARASSPPMFSAAMTAPPRSSTASTETTAMMIRRLRRRACSSSSSQSS